MILAGDIGGTYCRLALFKRVGSRLVCKAIEKYASKKYDGLDKVVEQFLRQCAAANTIESAVFGIAGPVEGDKRVETTNLPWVVDMTKLSTTINNERITLLNDLAANAYGACWLRDDDLFILNQGTPLTTGNRALISAGTGLGEAGLVIVDDDFIAIASEGGHCSFAPQNELEVELLNYLQKKYDGHVSWERLVSGRGLVNIYDFLCKRQPEKVQSLEQIAELKKLSQPARISRAGMLGLDVIAKESLTMFIGFYGAEAGNLALKFLARGALYIGGGIAPNILSAPQINEFMENFTNKGRFSDLLEQIPVYVILNDRAALLGATRIAASQLGYNLSEPPFLLNQY